MKKRDVTNLAASVRDRLLQRTRVRGTEFQHTLTNYGLERWLYRMTQSAHRERFVLKGAMLFGLWSEEPHRATQDLDLFGYGRNTIDEMETVFRDICALACEPDGLEFLPHSVQGSVIREDRKYEGVRIHLVAMLGKARIPLQIDVGYGDAVIPSPMELTYPIMLDFPAPLLRAYQRETVVAEKFHAMVERGIGNSRMKDYADLWFLTETFAFDGAVLLAAMEATFARQRTALPTGEPIGLTKSFGEHPAKLAQWRAFVRKNKLKAHDLALPEAVVRLYEFLMPLVIAMQTNASFNGQWLPETGWKV